MLWLLLLLALESGFWHFTPPSPRTEWYTGKETHIVGFAPDGRVLVTSENWGDGPIRLWDVESGTLRFVLAPDWSAIRRIEFSPDGRFLAAMNDPDDRFPAAMNDKENLRVWEIASGEKQLNRKLDNWFGYRFCPDSKHIIFENDGLVLFWNIDTKCVDASAPGRIRETAVARDGKSFAQWRWNQEGSAYACVRFWKLGEQPGTATMARQFDIPFYDIAFPTNLDIFVTVSRQSLSGQGAEFAVWDSVTGRKKASTTWQDREMGAFKYLFMHFSPDNNFVIADIRGAGRKFVKWDVRNDIKLVPTHAEWEPDLQSPDGKLLLVLMPDGAELLDAETLARRGILRTEGDCLAPHFGSFVPRVPYFRFSGDSKMVTSTGLVTMPVNTPISDWITSWFGASRPKRSWPWTGDPVARLYDADTASEVMAFHNCSQAHFSPDGQWIATGDDDGAIQIWHAPPRKSLLVLAVPHGIWLAAAFGAHVLARWLAKRRSKCRCAAAAPSETGPIGDR